MRTIVDAPSRQNGSETTRPRLQPASQRLQLQSRRVVALPQQRRVHGGAAAARAAGTVRQATALGRGPRVGDPRRVHPARLRRPEICKGQRDDVVGDRQVAAVQRRLQRQVQLQGPVRRRRPRAQTNQPRPDRPAGGRVRAVGRGRRPARPARARHARAVHRRRPPGGRRQPRDIGIAAVAAVGRRYLRRDPARPARVFCLPPHRPRRLAPRRKGQLWREWPRLPRGAAELRRLRLADGLQGVWPRPAVECGCVRA